MMAANRWRRAPAWVIMMAALPPMVGGMLPSLLAADEAPRTELRFSVSLDRKFGASPKTGRLIVCLQPAGRITRAEPRGELGATGAEVSPAVARDALNFTPDAPVILDRTSQTYPIASLDRLPAGDYRIQALLMLNPDILLTGAPGNLYSKVERVRLDPAKGGTHALTLTEQMSEHRPPADTALVKFIQWPSKRLSEFHGRPMVLRAAVTLPSRFEDEPKRKYPLLVEIGGFGTRYLNASRMGVFRRLRQLAADDPQVISVLLDGAGPFGDPYQVNSANNGPYGDALVEELIPHLEATYRGIGQPNARFLTGASTGGWVAVGLQVFYPDFFGGCYAKCPDSIDFRAFELVNIYQDDNAYVNRWGFDRPSCRDRWGEVKFTLRNECERENLLGLGDSFTMSGLDWGSWNAVYGPRGANRRPVPLWDPKTGKIDHQVAKQWEKYDLRLVVERNWKTLAPKLNGKIYIWVGDADDYYLNKGVALFKQAVEQLQPAFQGRIIIEPGATHTGGGISRRDMLREIVAKAGGSSSP